MACIRVLHFIPAFNYGGIETVIMNLFRNIDRNIIVFDFLFETNVENDLTKEIEMLGGKIYRIPKYRRVNFKEYYEALDKIFSEHNNYNIVHAHTVTRVPILFYIAKKYGIENRIIHAHTTKFSNNIIEEIYKKMVCKINIKLSTNLFACSNVAAKYYYGEKRVKDVYIMRNAINIEKYIYSNRYRQEMRSKFHLTEEFVIGNIGRIVPQKNHEFLIDIFKEYLELDPGSKLLLIGDGNLKSNIENKVHCLNLKENVIFAGERKDVEKIMAALDVMLFPSIVEGLPLVLVEAQACGLPIVASDTITREIKLTDLVEFLPINESPKYWAKILFDYKNKCQERKDYSKSITEKGYNVKENATEIENIYIDMYEI